MPRAVGKSATSTKYNRGPRIDPCCMPYKIKSVSEMVLP
jgi:hypothetical protein